MKSIFRISTLLSILVLLQTSLFATEIPNALKGEIDLGNWDFKDQGIVELHGQWEFYWNEMLVADDFLEENQAQSAKYIVVPGKWNNGDINGNSIPAHGFGTYRLMVKLKSNDNLNLKISGVSTAYKLWVNNEFLGQVGEVGTAKDDYLPKLKPMVFNIDPSTTFVEGEIRYIEIILQVSNYYHVNSGIWESVELGSFNDIQNAERKSNLFTAIIIGILLIMALYHFALYYLRRDEYSALFFGIFAFTMAIRAAITDNRLILEIFPNFNFSLLVRMEYLSAYTNIIFAGLFFYFLFKQDISKRIIQIVVVLGSLISAIILFTPMSFFTSLRDVYNVFVLICGIYVTFFALVKAMINKRPNSMLAFIGMFILFGTGVFDIVITIAVIQFTYLAPFGLVFYVLVQSYILSKRYSLAFSENMAMGKKLNYQNQHLEKIVDERTSEITRQKEELLKSEYTLKENLEELTTAEEELRQNNEALHTLNINIEEQKGLIQEKEQRLKTIIENQGDGFTIINSNEEFVLVNPAAEEIFGVEKGQLLGRSLTEFLDAMQSQTLSESAKGDEKGKLIYEMSIVTSKNEKKHLQITRTPDLDKNGAHIGSIGVIRDVTELKQAEFELNEKNKELNRYFVAIEQSSATIVFTDLKGNIEYANPQFSLLTGYSLHETIGKNIRILKSGKTANTVYVDLWNTISKGDTWEGEFVNCKKEGTEFIEKAIISPIKNNQGEVISYIAIKEDITERKLLNTKLVELLENTKTQKQLIENAHKDITASINYAKRIQHALLPNPQIIKEIFPEHFVFFQPKEAVSGDFFYLNKIDDTIVFAAADCTGHGVPGAFMTILSITFLNEIIKREKIIIPSDILEQLRFRIKSIFAQFGGENSNGLDMALCALNTTTNTLQFAGANNPLLIVRDEELIEYKPTRAPIGKYPKLINFENNEIQMHDNDIIYISSDGYQDQFGGHDKRKFTKKRFKQLLLNNSKLAMDEQKEILGSTMVDWMGVNSQIDDIVIMGLKWSFLKNKLD